MPAPNPQSQRLGQAISVLTRIEGQAESLRARFKNRGDESESELADLVVALAGAARMVATSVEDAVDRAAETGRRPW